MTLFVTVLRTAELASAKKDGSIVAELTLVGDETGSKPAVLCAHTLHTTMLRRRRWLRRRVRVGLSSGGRLLDSL